jgi:hypothetical protein
MEQDEGWDQVHIIVSFKSKVIQQLCCGRARRLEAGGTMPHQTEHDG